MEMREPFDGPLYRPCHASRAPVSDVVDAPGAMARILVTGQAHMLSGRHVLQPSNVLGESHLGLDEPGVPLPFHREIACVAVTV